VRWDARWQRFIAEETVGYSPAGKRIVRSGSGKPESAARANLRERVREYKAGLTPEARYYTVRHAVEDWLSYGLPGRSASTVDKCTTLCQTHIIPSLGAPKLRRATWGVGWCDFRMSAHRNQTGSTPLRARP
jgi:hypothetical protein